MQGKLISKSKTRDLEHANGDVAAYIDGIGERLRNLRARRGMTRRDLARHSDVSERYLAQLEGGKANISIALLWRIAEGMGVDIAELLSPQEQQRDLFIELRTFLDSLSMEDQKSAYGLLLKHFAASDTQAKGIALIGLRGAGKSTIGEMLAKKLNLPFMQLSKTIEEHGGMEIGNVFSLGGQRTYRRLERETLEYVIENCDRVVLETGGSVISEKETYSRLIGSFFTVWIKADPEDHMRRVLEQGDSRPMAGNAAAMDDLKLILSEREPYYRAASLIVDSSRHSATECINQIVAKYRFVMEDRSPA